MSGIGFGGLSLVSILLVAGFFAAPASADEFSGVESLLSENREGEEDEGSGEAVELTDEEKAEARRHFESGGQRYKDGEFREAIDHFERAYEITHAPELLYNVGKCYEELEDGERAVENYEMYLRMKPDAEDSQEVEERIDRLQGGEDADIDGESKGVEEQGRGIPKGIRFQLDLGLSVPLGGEWERKALPLDLQFHFPLADWLYIGAGIVFGAFVGDELALNGYPEGEFGFNVGLIGAWNLSDRLTLIARLGLVPTWVFRSHQQKNAIWLDIQGGVGLAIRLIGPWALTAEVIGGFGPVFVPSARSGDLWPNDGVSPSADIGGRVGFLYTF